MDSYSQERDSHNIEKHDLKTYEKSTNFTSNFKIGIPFKPHTYEKNFSYYSMILSSLSS